MFADTEHDLSSYMGVFLLNVRIAHGLAAGRCAERDPDLGINLPTRGRNPRKAMRSLCTMLAHCSPIVASSTRPEAAASPLVSALGEGRVIKGWDVGVASTMKGSLVKITQALEYVYGDAGSPPEIPEKKALVFAIELFGWTSEDASSLRSRRAVVGSIRSRATQCSAA